MDLFCLITLFSFVKYHFNESIRLIKCALFEYLIIHVAFNMCSQDHFTIYSYTLIGVSFKTILFTNTLIRIYVMYDYFSI